MLNNKKIEKKQKTKIITTQKEVATAETTHHRLRRSTCLMKTHVIKKKNTNTNTNNFKTLKSERMLKKGISACIAQTRKFIKEVNFNMFAFLNKNKKGQPRTFFFDFFSCNAFV